MTDETAVDPLMLLIEQLAASQALNALYEAHARSIGVLLHEIKTLTNGLTEARAESRSWMMRVLLRFEPLRSAGLVYEEWAGAELRPAVTERVHPGKAWADLVWAAEEALRCDHCRRCARPGSNESCHDQLAEALAKLKEGDDG